MKMMIVDDHDIFRQSLALMLSQQKGCDVAAHFNTVDCLLAQPSDKHLDAILLDYHMPGTSPLGAITTIKKRWPQAKLVFLTGTRSVAILKRMLASPADGLLHKSDCLDLILEMLAEVALGQRAVSPAILAEVESLDFDLTSKELDVLVLLTQGNIPKQIAESLFLSKRTVEKHKENIMRKTKARHLAELIEIGHRLILTD